MTTQSLEQKLQIFSERLHESIRITEELKPYLPAIRQLPSLKTIPKPQRLVFIHNGREVTTTRLIAQKFGKKHYHVIRDVKNLECSEEFRLSNFGLSSYLNSQNREMPEYIVTWDGFTFLAMGFTGKQAARFKEEYINEFNRMRNRLLPQPDYYTVSGFAALHGLPIDLKAAIHFGRKASSLCRSRGVDIQKVKDDRFGHINSYPTSILEEVFVS